MFAKLIKSTLCICILIFGTGAFAQSLNSIEIKSNLQNGTIALDTDMKSSVKKIKISADEIKLVLKNTNVADNIKTTYNNTSSYNGISIIQNGKNTYINIEGKNISEYELLFANDKSTVPISSGLNATGILTLITLLCIGLFKIIKNISQKRKENLRKIVLEQTLRQQKIEAEQRRIRELKTLRAKIQNSNNTCIHGNSLPKFASNSGMSIPQTQKQNNAKLFAKSEFKKAVNL